MDPTCWFEANHPPLGKFEGVLAYAVKKGVDGCAVDLDPRILGVCVPFQEHKPHERRARAVPHVRIELVAGDGRMCGLESRPRIILFRFLGL